MDVSVIICTRNRIRSIESCLQTIVLAVAKVLPATVELIVVDNGSTDGTSDYIRDWAAKQAFPVCLVQEPKAGLSIARNSGVKASKGRLLAFTDDDCCMSETYIQELLQYDKNDAELVMRSGSVVLGDPTDLPLTIKSVTAVQQWKRPMSVANEGGLLSSLIGCNMTMRRTIFDQVGEFDERLGAGTKCPAGEDTDYFYRVYLAGFRLEMVPGMIVAHYHGRKTLESRTKLLRNYALGNGALAAKYIFRYPTFSRHIIWQIKHYFCYLFGMSRKENEAAWLSPHDSTFYMFKGIFIYFVGSQICKIGGKS